jgi:hypothetical protein
VSGGLARQAPRQGAARRRQQQEEQDDASIAANGKGRRHERRDPGRMDRINLSVPSANAEIRREVAGKVGAVVAAAMVVLDLQIAIAQQTLGDDQVMRLVTGRKRRPYLREGHQADDERQSTGECRAPGFERPGQGMTRGTRRQARGDRNPYQQRHSPAPRQDHRRYRHRQPRDHHDYQEQQRRGTGASAQQPPRDRSRDDRDPEHGQRVRHQPDTRAVCSRIGDEALREPRGHRSDERAGDVYGRRRAGASRGM